MIADMFSLRRYTLLPMLLSFLLIPTSTGGQTAFREDGPVTEADLLRVLSAQPLFLRGRWKDDALHLRQKAESLRTWYEQVSRWPAWVWMR